MKVRNTSNLPLEVTQVAWEISTAWMVPNQRNGKEVFSWTQMAGTEARRHFTNSIEIPPEATKEMRIDNYIVTDMRPSEAIHLSTTNEGLRCRVKWLLVTDSANRRWYMHPGKGRRARRFRWYSRRYSNYPFGWKNLTFRAKVEVVKWRESFKWEGWKLALYENS
jgi:hypothetical protein